MTDLDATDTTRRSDRPRRFRWLPVGVGAVLAAGLVIGLLATVDGDGNGPEVGSLAPDFSVRTLDGDRFSLSDHLAGDRRPVFLNLWAAWCFPCREEMPAIDAVANDRPDVHFIGVVVDDDEAPAREFVEQRNIGYQIGLDEERVVKEEYQVWAMPSTFLIDSEGRVVRRIFGPLDIEELESLIEELLDA
jgi:thiol-disulfide isomerase/thioredoxin